MKTPQCLIATRDNQQMGTKEESHIGIKRQFNASRISIVVEH